MDNYQWDTLMQTSNLIIIACSAVLINELYKTKSTRKRPTCRVNPYLLERNAKGRFATDFEDLMKNKKSFQENFHMSVEAFHSLFKLIEPHLLPKRNVRPHDSISPMQKLAIVLEYFASGDLQRHTASCYRISKQHFGPIIDLVCDAICTTLKPNMPELKKDVFIDIANGFHAHWNFPNCIGAIDGKHVALKAPPIEVESTQPHFNSTRVYMQLNPV